MCFFGFKTVAPSAVTDCLQSCTPGLGAATSFCKRIVAHSVYIVLMHLHAHTQHICDSLGPKQTAYISPVPVQDGAVTCRPLCWQSCAWVQLAFLRSRVSSHVASVSGQTSSPGGLSLATIYGDAE